MTKRHKRNSLVTGERRDMLIGGTGMLGLAALIATVYAGGAEQKARDGYDVTARFNKAEGVAVGSDVRLSGVVVGKIVAQALDDQFHAVLTLRLAPSVALPKDSNAAIETDGLLGDKYVALQPGGDEDTLKPGDRITYSQDSLAVEDLLEMIIEQAKSAHGVKPTADGGAS
jgi:phospholipid/cholesterol/gamma-HCH transport system substrate-binding protein